MILVRVSFWIMHCTYIEMIKLMLTEYYYPWAQLPVWCCSPWILQNCIPSKMSVTRLFLVVLKQSLGIDLLDREKRGSNSQTCVLAVTLSGYTSLLFVRGVVVSMWCSGLHSQQIILLFSNLIWSTLYVFSYLIPRHAFLDQVLIARWVNDD